jgi:hypothetical protein
VQHPAYLDLALHACALWSTLLDVDSLACKPCPTGLGVCLCCLCVVCTKYLACMTLAWIRWLTALVWLRPFLKRCPGCTLPLSYGVELYNSCLHVAAVVGLCVGHEVSRVPACSDCSVVQEVRWYRR